MTICVCCQREIADGELCGDCEQGLDDIMRVIYPGRMVGRMVPQAVQEMPEVSDDDERERFASRLETCPTCYGYGHTHSVIASGIDNAGVPWARYEPCTTCMGTGRATRDEGDAAARSWREQNARRDAGDVMRHMDIYGSEE